MSISATSRDIVNRVKALPELSNRVGFTVGAQDMDPMNDKLTLPFVWIIYTGDNLVSTNEINPGCEFIKLNYIVKVAIDYDRDENELIDTRLPLLHTIADALVGETPAILPGSAWLYEGQSVESIDSDRQVWVQNYSIKFGL
ncbi:MAG: hypothetical protein DRQ46_09370 [Gammaproteobacteria bacterium]|nr:MAG: hypothetical protein DRQ46_09370 [Gammaproteobacteria bacterium]